MLGRSPVRVQRPHRPEPVRPPALDALRWLAWVLCGSAAEACFVPQRERADRPASRRRPAGTFGWLRLADGRGYLIPLGSSRAAVGALDLYNTQSLRAKLARAALKVGLRAAAGTRWLPRIELVDGRDRGPRLLEHLKEILGRRDVCFAISCGTPGPHRKPVVLILTGDGRALAYVKVGTDGVTNALVEHEALVLVRLAQGGACRSFEVPRVLHAGRWNGRYLCVQSGPSLPPKPAPRIPPGRWLAIPRDLAAYRSRPVPLAASELWRTLPHRIAAIPDAGCRRLLMRGAHRAATRIRGTPLPFHFCHGDLAPWNMKPRSETLFVFDWEYAREDGLPAQDIFHFQFQTLQRLGRRAPDDIYAAFSKPGPVRTSVAVHLASLGLPDAPLEAILALYRADQLAAAAADESGIAAVHHEAHAFAALVRTIERSGEGPRS